MSSLVYSRGFTLIELLVVIGIIGILTALGAASYSNAQQKARDTQRKSNISSLQSALECYFSDNGTYPAQGAYQPTLKNKGCLPSQGPNVPFTDPKTGSAYTYTPTATGTKYFSYSLLACLENVNDPDQDSSKNSACTVASYTKYNP